MNEKGELLSIEEVRDRIIHDKPLIINPEANWNHKVSNLKEDYLFNIWQKTYIECLVQSTVILTLKKGKVFTYVELLPLDTYRQLIQKLINTNVLAGTTEVNYKTNNPAIFWANPE